jgi:hypothetical protein
MGEAQDSAEHTSATGRQQHEWIVAVIVIVVLSIPMLLVTSGSMGAFIMGPAEFCPSSTIVHRIDQKSSLAMTCQDMIRAQGAR